VPGSVFLAINEKLLIPLKEVPGSADAAGGNQEAGQTAGAFHPKQL